MTVHDVLHYLDLHVAPLSLKESWDNVGLLLGRGKKPVTKVLVALDATGAVCAEAKALGCDLVVTHHPVIFHPTGHVTDDPMTETVLDFLESGIAVISMHTNLDLALDGVNDVLAETLGLDHIMTLESDEDESLCHLIRTGFVEPCELPDFAAFVKDRLGCPGLRYASGGKPVREVAVGGGACAGYIEFAAESGADTFVTADLKYHDFQLAEKLGLNLIDAGHFETENPVIASLAARLGEQFPELEVRIAHHGDCIRYL